MMQWMGLQAVYPNFSPSQKSHHTLRKTAEWDFGLGDTNLQRHHHTKNNSRCYLYISLEE